MILMDPIISNFLAANIVKWLRSIVEVQDSTLDENINYNGKLLNLAEHAPAAVCNNTKIPKLDKDLKENFWNAMKSLIIEEQTKTTNESVLETIAALLRKSEIARQVFVQYILDRVSAGDLFTLSKCLPLLLQTQTPQMFEDESSQIYIGCIHTLMETVMKRYLMECITVPAWKNIIVEGFLLKVVGWSVKLHEQMIRFLAEYYADPNKLKKLGAHSAIIAAWSEATFRNGLKDEKVNAYLSALSFVTDFSSL